MTTIEADAKTAKGRDTRAKILDAALALFREKGYEETTMRAISERAGVALGNAYYYYRSKEHLIQGFYETMYEEHVRIAGPGLGRKRDFKSRLAESMDALLEAIEPFHPFAGILFANAADPRSPLNPFSPESEHVRTQAISFYVNVIEGCKERVPDDLRSALPFLLWLHHMGIVLYWIHDNSPKRKKTHCLVGHTVDLVAQLVRLASHPLMRPMRRRALGLLHELKHHPS